MMAEVRGLLFPLRRGPSDFESGTGMTLRMSNARNVLACKAAGFNGRISGDLPWRKDFGTWVHLLRHSRPSDMRGEFAITYLIQAIARWEPRIRTRTAESFIDRSARSSRTQRIRLYFEPSGQSGQGATQPQAPYEDVSL